MEEMSPTKSAGREPVRTIVRPAGTSGISLSQPVGSANVPREVLVIASRLKEFVAAKADMNTSASVMDVLSDHLRVICERGIDNARADGRKTLMDRDFSFLKSMK